MPPLRALNVVRSGTAFRSCALIGPRSPGILAVTTRAMGSKELRAAHRLGGPGGCRLFGGELQRLDVGHEIGQPHSDPGV